jgi:hypothetical protein
MSCLDEPYAPEGLQSADMLISLQQ